MYFFKKQLGYLFHTQKSFLNCPEKWKADSNSLRHIKVGVCVSVCAIGSQREHCS